MRWSSNSLHPGDVPTGTTSTTSTSTSPTTTPTTATAADTTAISASTTTAVPIADIKLPNRTILQAYENNTSRGFYYQNVLGRDVAGDRNSTIQAFDKSYGTGVAAATGPPPTATKTPPKAYDDANDRTTVHFLEEIARHARNDPSGYHVHVERTGDMQNRIIVRIEDRSSTQGYTTRELPTARQTFVKQESPSSSETDRHVLHIKIPYNFVDNVSFTEKHSGVNWNFGHQEKQEISGTQAAPESKKQPAESAFRGSGSQPELVFRRNQAASSERAQEVEQNFRRLPPRYIDNQNGYLYHVKIQDFDRGSPVNGVSPTEQHQIRRKESAAEKAGEIQHDDKIGVESKFIDNPIN